MTLTLPRSLKMLNVPLLDSGTFTLFGVGAPPARGLRLLVPGFGPSPQNVRKVLDVGPAAVTFSESDSGVGRDRGGPGALTAGTVGGDRDRLLRTDGGAAGTDGEVARSGVDESARVDRDVDGSVPGRHVGGGDVQPADARGAERDRDSSADGGPSGAECGRARAHRGKLVSVGRHTQTMADCLPFVTIRREVTDG